MKTKRKHRQNNANKDDEKINGDKKKLLLKIENIYKNQSNEANFCGIGSIFEIKINKGSQGKWRVCIKAGRMRNKRAHRTPGVLFQI